MTFEFEAPETVDTGGGNWLKDPGTYHAIVTHVDENPTSKNGQALDAFRVTLQVLDGTVGSQADKQVELTFWNPKLTDKNEGLFAKQKQARFLIATGLITEQQLGHRISVDLQQAEGRQVVATIEANERDGKSFMDLSYADIWHIDDPAAAKFPKSEKALRLVPADQRRKPDSFTKSEEKPKETAAAATSAASDLDDL